MAYLSDRNASSILQWGHVTDITGAARFSISLKLYVTGPTSYDSMISQLDPTLAYGISFYNIGTDPTSFAWSVRDGATAGRNVINTGAFISDAWNALHLVFDGTATGAARGRAWVGGTEITSWNESIAYPATVGANSGLLALSSEIATYSFWSGRFAELAIWPGVAITDPYVIRAMAGGLSAAVAHPLKLAHYMPMSRASGTCDVIQQRFASIATAMTLVEQPFIQQPYRRHLVSQLITSIPSVAWLPVSRVAQGPVTRFAPGGMVPPG